MSGSPVISLIPCASFGEECMSAPMIETQQNTKSKLVSKGKLSFSSKVFVKNSSVSKGNRKASQDTKAHSEDEGNTSDEYDENLRIPKTLSFSKSKSYAVSKAPLATSDKFTNSENAPISFQIKFKTEMCKNWQIGECKFGSKCSFAHGVEELSEKRHVPTNYKTKVCKQFHEELYCSYGARCQFIHLETSETSEDGQLGESLYSVTSLSSPKRSPKSRLAVFKALTN